MVQHVLPLLIGGQPRQFLIPGKQPTRSCPTKGFARHIMAATDRVVLAELPLNERVTKQAQNGDALLHGRVGEAPTTLDGEEFGPLWIGTVSQILDVEGHLLAGDGFRNNPWALANG